MPNHLSGMEIAKLSRSGRSSLGTWICSGPYTLHRTATVSGSVVLDMNGEKEEKQAELTAKSKQLGFTTTWSARWHPQRRVTALQRGRQGKAHCGQSAAAVELHCEIFGGGDGALLASPSGRLSGGKPPLSPCCRKPRFGQYPLSYLLGGYSHHLVELAPFCSPFDLMQLHDCKFNYLESASCIDLASPPLQEVSPLCAEVPHRTRL